MTDKIEYKGKVDPIDSVVGRRLKVRRVMLGLSQNDLAEAVNVSIQQIQKYEKATNRISSGRLFAFARLLKIPVSYFYENIENESFSYAEAHEESNIFGEDNNVLEKELISLVKSYSIIKDSQVRKKLNDLIKALAEAS